MLPVMVPPVAVFCSMDGHPSPPYFRHCDASVHAKAQMERIAIIIPYRERAPVHAMCTPRWEYLHLYSSDGEEVGLSRGRRLGHVEYRCIRGWNCINRIASHRISSHLIASHRN